MKTTMQPNHSLFNTKILLLQISKQAKINKLMAAVKVAMITWPTQRRTMQTVSKFSKRMSNPKLFRHLRKVHSKARSKEQINKLK